MKVVRRGTFGYPKVHQTRAGIYALLATAMTQTVSMQGGASSRSAGGIRTMQGVRGGEHLPAPASKEHMQGVQGGEHLSAPAHQESMQGVCR